MFTKPGVKGRLLKDGNIIDDSIECAITIERRGQYSSILEGHGEIKTSKPLPVSQYDIPFNVENIRFELILDDPMFKKAEKIPIVLTDVEWKEKKWASFEVKHLR
jgi:hypothetical protein